MTFREAINHNKQAILKYLDGKKEYTSTHRILINYSGEKQIEYVRTALKELNDEGKVKFRVQGVNTKYWLLER